MTHPTAPEVGQVFEHPTYGTITVKRVLDDMIELEITSKQTRHWDLELWGMTMRHIAALAQAAPTPAVDRGE